MKPYHRQFYVYFILMSCFIVSPLFSQHKAAPNSKLAAAKRILPGIQSIEINRQSDRPVWFKGAIARDVNLGNAPQVENFMLKNQQAFGLTGDGNTFIVKRSRKDALGQTHTRVQHLYKGVPVFGSEMILHADRTGTIDLINGQLVDELDLDTNPQISPAQALKAAQDDLGPATYRWEIPELENILKAAYNDPSKTWKPAPELVISAMNGQFLEKDFRLTYKFMLATENPAANWTYFVDAKTGAIVNRWNSMHETTATGSGPTLYSGTVSIQTEDTGSEFQMYDAVRNIKTYNANNSTSLPGTLYTDADNVWDSPGMPAAVEIHWGSMSFYDYYSNVHGRNSIDNAGMQIIGSVHYSSNYNNASWDGSQARFGDGDGTQFDPLVTIDIAAHEFTHGVTDFESNLVYQSEPGALNEALSDMFGVSVDFYARPAQANWAVGEECYTPGTPGDALRFMDDPNKANDPDTYEGTYWASTANPSPFNDWGGVHTNSGVANYHFYLLSDGGSGTNDNGTNYNVTGIGIDKTSKIWYRAQTTYLTTNSQYADARNATLNSAIDLYGSGSAEYQSTLDGWVAVGVGNGGGTNTPPVPTISEPVDGGDYTVNQSMNFSGDATDNEDGTVAASGFKWIVNGPGVPPNHVFASGVKSGTVVPPNTGSYTMTLEVTDSGGETASTSVTFNVITGGGGNTAPVATITAPANGASYAVGATVNFSGTGTDDEDGTLAASAFTWKYSYNGGAETVFASGVKSGSGVLSYPGTYKVILIVEDSQGATDRDEVTITASGSAIAGLAGSNANPFVLSEDIPEAFDIFSSYPNPFNPETNIYFNLKSRQQVELAIYNIMGQKIRTLADETMDAGSRNFQWDGRNAAGNMMTSGLYYARLITSGQAKTIKLVLMK